MHDDENTVFAAFNNHKRGDFKPYLFKSTDRGATWTSITGDLPERGSTYSIVQDHVNPNLLFAGTEFGVFFTVDGGKKWVQLKAGIPTISARELVIQRRENDLVVGSFGRGIFILDDYTPLRQVSEAELEKDTVLFPVKKAWMFTERTPLGVSGKGFQGEDFYNAPNPPLGAVFTYYVKDCFKSLKKQRQEKEKKIEEEGGTIEYPSWDELRAEAHEGKAKMVLTVRDAAGNVVRRVKGPASKGFHRVNWDLHYAEMKPVSLKSGPKSPWAARQKGPKAVPGTYTVTLGRLHDGKLEEFGEPQSFETASLGVATLEAEDKQAVLEFEAKVAELQRAAYGAGKLLGDVDKRLDYIRKALMTAPGASAELFAKTEALEAKVREMMVAYRGDSVVRSHNEPTAPGIYQRISRIVTSQWMVSSAPTQTHRDNYEIAAEEFGVLLGDLKQLVQGDLVELEKALDEAGAPYTPGRFPTWNP